MQKRSSKQPPNAWIRPGLVPITEGEADALRAPASEEIGAVRKAKILARLDKIDQDIVRPLDAKDEGTAIEYDLQKLAALRAEKRALRTELAGLEQAG
jgi:hypothetical protein